jgi:copper chaperone CopZ
VTTALKDLTGVEEVEVKLRERTVRVRHSAEVAAPAFVAALNEAGYPSRAA